MNDLDQLLRDAADTDGWGRLDPREVLVAGKRRVRRRRLTAAGTAAAAVAVVAVVVAAVSAPGDRRADVVDRPERGSGTYTEVRISEAEVEARCTTVLNQRLAVDEGWMVDPDPRAPRTVETREGFPVQLSSTSRAGTAAPQTCVIPQAALLDGIGVARDEPVPAPDDATAIADLCSRRVGYDLTGWEVVTRVGYDGGVAAMLVSDNGYFAACSLTRDGGGTIDIDPTGWRDASGDPVGTDADITLPRVSDAVVKGGDGELSSLTYGVLAGLPDDYRVLALGRQGRVLASTTTTRGAYVLVVEGSRRDIGGFLVTKPDGTPVASTALPEEHRGL